MNLVLGASSSAVDRTPSMPRPGLVARIRSRRPRGPKQGLNLKAGRGATGNLGTDFSSIFQNPRAEWYGMVGKYTSSAICQNLSVEVTENHHVSQV